ncbi:putative Ig domain-containing protein [Leptospira adleri]|uniref:putative Ig domain-containing protein n=2 Tax=Leptospira adleri TaxID=2023186 RepID=UPI001FAFEEF8|nr:putative Ig domain-containing protein [Leptospira adleri]
MRSKDKTFDSSRSNMKDRNVISLRNFSAKSLFSNWFRILFYSLILLIFFSSFSACLQGSFGSPAYLNLFSFKEGPLSDLRYPVSSYQYTTHTRIPTFRPSLQGTATEFSITPELPSGIALDTTTGALSGIPKVRIPSTEYTITAKNESGSTSTKFTLSPTLFLWNEGSYLKASNSDRSDSLGWAVALDGDTLVVGAYLESSSQTTVTNGNTASADNSADGSGAAYVYRRNGVGWVQEAYLKAPNAEAWDSFGYSVAIQGDTIVIGAIGEGSSQTTITNGNTASADNSAPFSGAVYVYKRTGNNWDQEAYIKASNAEAGDSFGYSVAIQGDTIAVGAYAEASNQTTITNGNTSSADNSNGNSGAVYVYKRTGNNWDQEAFIKAVNGEAGDLFGYSISLSGNTLVVGAPSESSNQTTITNGNTASADNSNGNSGAAYVYVRTGSAWAQEAYLKAASVPPTPGQQLGITVSIYGDTIAASATQSNEGAVHVFVRNAGAWTREAEIRAANPGVVNYFGFSLSIYGDTIAVGTYWEDGNENRVLNGTTASMDNSLPGSGAVYVYQRTGTTWAQQSYIKAKNVQSNDWFGYSVAISDDTVIAGAPQEDGGQTANTDGPLQSWNELKPDSGAIYVYNR